MPGFLESHVYPLFGWAARVAQKAAAAVDPVRVSATLPEIKAAAAYWRMKVETAPVADGNRQPDGVVLHERLTAEELDRYEQELVQEFARGRALVQDNPIFDSPRGLEIVIHLACAARAAGVNEKIKTWGYMTRMRILPTTVDHEVGTIFEYRHCNWHNVWTSPEV